MSRRYLGPAGVRCQPNFWNFCRYIYRMGDVGSDHDWFRYDEANRLVRASVKEDPTGQRTQQDYDYDAFGNITEVKTWPPGQSSQTTTIQVNANTNRLSAAGYDASGNMTSWGSDSYTYDTGNQMVQQNGRWYFLYTFSGERVATIDWQGSIATREVDWTIRGPGNQVLSTFKLVGEDQAGNWSREMDYIWMGRRLLGTEEDPGGPNATVKHYHTDHLGTIRLITDSAGNKVSEHEYLPYGQELTAAGNGVMKFTGHERDLETGMDYMHARFYSNFLGRFNSVDPILGGGGVLNRYSYVGGNPVGRIDPDGRELVCTQDSTGKIKDALVSAARTPVGRGVIEHQDQRSDQVTIERGKLEDVINFGVPTKKYGEYYRGSITIDLDNLADGVYSVDEAVIHELLHGVYSQTGGPWGRWDLGDEEESSIRRIVSDYYAKQQAYKNGGKNPPDRSEADAEAWLNERGIVGAGCQPKTPDSSPAGGHADSMKILNLKMYPPELAPGGGARGLLSEGVTTSGRVDGFYDPDLGQWVGGTSVSEIP